MRKRWVGVAVKCQHALAAASLGFNFAAQACKAWPLGQQARRFIEPDPALAGSIAGMQSIVKPSLHSARRVHWETCADSVIHVPTNSQHSAPTRWYSVSKFECTLSNSPSRSHQPVHQLPRPTDMLTEPVTALNATCSKAGGGSLLPHLLFSRCQPHTKVMKSAVVALLAVFAVTLAVEVTLNTKFIVGTSWWLLCGRDAPLLRVVTSSHVCARCPLGIFFWRRATLNVPAVLTPVISRLVPATFQVTMRIRTPRAVPPTS